MREDGEFAPWGEAVAAVEDAEAVAAHLVEEPEVDGAHDFGGTEGAPVGGGEGVGGLGQEVFGAGGLEIHQGEEAIVVGVRHEVVRGVLEAGEVGEGEVDARVVREVLSDVTQDVGELKGVAEGDGVVAAVGAGAEKWEGEEADGPGDAVGVLPEILHGFEALRGDVGFAAADDFEEEIRREAMAGAEVAHLGFEGARGAARVREGRFPCGEFLLFAGWGPFRVVRDVVDGTAEGVESDEVAAAVPRHAGQGEGEVRLRPAGDGGGGRYCVGVVRVSGVGVSG